MYKSTLKYIFISYNNKRGFYGFYMNVQPNQPNFVLPAQEHAPQVNPAPQDGKTALEELHQLIDTFKACDDLPEKRALQFNIRMLIQDLKKQNIDCTSIQKELEPLFADCDQRYSNVRTWIQSKHQNLSSSSPKCSKEDLVAVCIDEQQYRLLPDVIREKHVMVASTQDSFDKTIFQFLLDKTWGVQHYEGGWTKNQAAILAEMLRNQLLIQNGQLTPEEEHAIKTILPLLIQSLSLCSAWSADESTERAARQIVQLIENQVSFPILIPAKSKMHAMSIVLEIFKDQNKARITLCNTGDDYIEYHPRLFEHANLFQTAWSITDVPMENLTSVEIWKNLLQVKNEQDAEQVYTIFLEKLGKNGRLESPSLNPLDYEQIQLHGTCSAQHLMAFMRYQLMKLFDGYNLEKWAIYKSFKARTMTYLAQGVFSEIRLLAQQKLLKYEADLSLLQAVKDDREYVRYKTALTNALEKIGEHAFLESFSDYEAERTFEKYGLLRLYHRQIASHWLSHPENHLLESLSDPIFRLSCQMFKNKSTLREAIFNDLESMHDLEAIATTIVNLRANFLFPLDLINWLAGAATPKLIKLLMKKFSPSNWESFKQEIKAKGYADLLALIERQEHQI